MPKTILEKTMTKHMGEMKEGPKKMSKKDKINAIIKKNKRMGY